MAITIEGLTKSCCYLVWCHGTAREWLVRTGGNGESDRKGFSYSQNGVIVRLSSHSGASIGSASTIEFNNLYCLIQRLINCYLLAAFSIEIDYLFVLCCVAPASVALVELARSLALSSCFQYKFVYFSFIQKRERERCRTASTVLSIVYLGNFSNDSNLSLLKLSNCRFLFPTCLLRLN